jgi:hypothetical protein
VAGEPPLSRSMKTPITAMSFWALSKTMCISTVPLC